MVKSLDEDVSMQTDFRLICHEMLGQTKWNDWMIVMRYKRKIKGNIGDRFPTNL